MALAGALTLLLMVVFPMSRFAMALTPVMVYDTLQRGTQSNGAHRGSGADVRGFGIQGLGGCRLMAPYLRFHQFPRRSDRSSLLANNNDDPTLRSTSYNPSTDGSGLHTMVPYFPPDFPKGSPRLLSGNPDVVYGGFTENLSTMDYTQAGMNTPIIQDSPAIPGAGHMEVGHADRDIHPPRNSEP